MLRVNKKFEWTPAPQKHLRALSPLTKSLKVKLYLYISIGLANVSSNLVKEVVKGHVLIYISKILTKI